MPGERYLIYNFLQAIIISYFSQAPSEHNFDLASSPGTVFMQDNGN